MKGESVEQMLCLSSWQASGLIKLDQGLFRRAVGSADNAALPEDRNNTPLSSDNLQYHEQSYGVGDSSD